MTGGYVPTPSRPPLRCRLFGHAWQASQHGHLVRCRRCRVLAAVLLAGEHVLTRAEVERLGGQLAARLRELGAE